MDLVGDALVGDLPEVAPPPAAAAPPALGEEDFAPRENPEANELDRAGLGVDAAPGGFGVLNASNLKALAVAAGEGLDATTDATPGGFGVLNASNLKAPAVAAGDGVVGLPIANGLGGALVAVVIGG